MIVDRFVKISMSLSRIRSCANCHKTEGQVEIKICYECKVITFCSDLCVIEYRESHKCKEPSRDYWKLRDTTYRSMLEVALTTDNHEVLKKIVDYNFSIDYPDLICIYIELGIFYA